MTRTTTLPTSTTTMRAVVQDRYGDADVLRPSERPVPRVLRPDEVLVRVHAAGLDRGTWHLMTGTPYAVRLVTGLRRPRQPVPGLDLAGTVEAVGAAVARFAPGDEVYGIGTGTYAEYAVAKEGKLAPKPAGLSDQEAATVAVSGLTALQSVTDIAGVRAGQRVLVTGASGGVGSYAVQIAVAAGAEVTGVCSAAKADLVRSLGAAHVLDYARDDIAGTGERYDVIIDIAGDVPLPRLRRALAPSGTAVLVGSENAGRITGMSRQLLGLVVSVFSRQRLTMRVPRERAADLERLSALIEAGRVTPSVGATYPLADAAEAMRDLVAGRVRGKVAIVVT
ncbi:MAG TPA: NAD(P)-dependent alcohol dehydrogenase [Nocardioides sp.]|uniref:NAD(P)-dependent alcohol dehydrogenase n=1 Tax=Nocardioides sp. TaxID=35761 RepID=UPI002E322F0D|nr:NAD(P)-dependent alcohol dehydrogenase [Nocardioides sp.]HEX5088097.1 NAD(P)-dependent alcohol dehydrogenase [Nocardioides sp.]